MHICTVCTVLWTDNIVPLVDLVAVGLVEVGCVVAVGSYGLMCVKVCSGLERQRLQFEELVSWCLTNFGGS